MALSRTQKQWAVGGSIGLGAFLLGSFVSRRRPVEMFARREHHEEHEGRREHQRGEYDHKEHGHHHKEHDRGER
jgi:hypothetical protein